MDKMILLLEEFILKAINLTETMIAFDYNNGDKLAQFTENRERLFHIMDQISKQIDWNQVEVEKKNELNRQIEFIKKLDEKLLTSLQEFSIETRKEIETTFRQKENIKGYNLNDVK